MSLGKALHTYHRIAPSVSDPDALEVPSTSYIPTNPITAMKVSHYPHDDPSGHSAPYNMSPPMGNPNYRPDASQYPQGQHQEQPHIQHTPDQHQYGYGSNQQIQPHRASQSSQGQGGQAEMLGRVPTRGANPLIPLDSPSNPNGTGEGAPILPAVQQQPGDQPPSYSMIELGRRYT